MRTARSKLMEPVFLYAIATKNRSIDASDQGRCAHALGVVALHVLRGDICCPDGCFVDASELLTQDIDWRHKNHLRSTEAMAHMKQRLALLLHFHEIAHITICVILRHGSLTWQHGQEQSSGTHMTVVDDHDCDDGNM
jgi:hypothetical protein